MLTNSSGFAGIDGLFRFRPDGTNQRGLAVMQVSPPAARSSVRRRGVRRIGNLTRVRRIRPPPAFVARLEAVVRGAAASRRGLAGEQDQVVRDEASC